MTALTAIAPELTPVGRHQAMPSDRLFAPIPIRQIMVLLNGPSSSERALPYATALAEATGAGISLMFVESPRDQASASTVNSMPAEYLAEIRAGLGPHVPHIRTRIARTEKAVRVCVDAECTDSTDLVVLAAPLSSPTDDAQYPIGHLAGEMIRHSQAPVLLIPPDAPPPPASMHILVPLDGSGQAENVLFPVIALTNASKGHYIREITLLMVCEKQQAMTAATAYVAEVLASLKRLVAPKIAIHAEVAHGRATRALAQHVNAQQRAPRFDLIAMTTHGEGGERKRLLGPVAEHMLSHTCLPVLLVDPTFS